MAPSSAASRSQRRKMADRLMVRRQLTFVIASIYTIGAVGLAQADAPKPQHGLAMHGRPALPPTFTHLPYVNPDAPKGGRLTLGLQGSFDSLNPYLARGVAPTGVRGYVHESLMARSGTEPFTLYGLLAESVEVPDDRSWIIFNIRPEARFADGKPVTSADVVFSHALLKRDAVPFMRSHYSKVSAVDVLGPRRVRFQFSATGDREIALIMGLMPILPKHATTRDDFRKTSLTPPLGSGPYRVASVDAGRSISYKRNEDYWGQTLPIRRGHFNFDEIRIEFFRDGTAAFSAFRTGATDVRVEKDPNRWSGGYDFPAVNDGRVIREVLPTALPDGMRAIVMNGRREIFRDARVRSALIRLFDFHWINRTLFNGLYARSASYFARSDLAALGQPASPGERALLKPFQKYVKPPVLEGTWRPSQSDGSGHDRAALRQAYGLLQEAGYHIRDGRMVHKRDGRQLRMTFLARTKAEERIMLAYQSSLKRLGIELTIRQVDAAQYWEQLKTFDYDMIQWRYPTSLSPGNEQINRWASSHADIDGSLTYAGTRNPAVDAMINAMLTATSRNAFEDAVRAFDRVLISGDYVIPLYHPPAVWVAYWNRIKRPETLPLAGIALETWWAKPGT